MNASAVRILAPATRQAMPPPAPSPVYRRAALMSAHRVSPVDDADFYPTPPWGARAGAELVQALDPGGWTAADPCCGAGHMVHGLADYFPRVIGSDLYAYDGNPLFDFVGGTAYPRAVDWFFFNPPFNRLAEFIETGLAQARRGVACLMRVAGLETTGRFDLMHGAGGHDVFAPFAERLPMHKGRWEPEGSSAAFYAWHVWTKPCVGLVKPVLLGAPRAVTVPIGPGTRTRLTRDSDAVLFGVRG
ncbi:MAG: hypothetical protein KF842_06860 [Caulobacter sp.]|nr:hypothetical protein [Caulobacter sp.]